MPPCGAFRFGPDPGGSAHCRPIYKGVTKCVTRVTKPEINMEKFAGVLPKRAVFGAERMRAWGAKD